MLPIGVHCAAQFSERASSTAVAGSGARVFQTVDPLATLCEMGRRERGERDLQLSLAELVTCLVIIYL